MTEIYLIRHGEAEGNVFRRLHGQYNSLLMPRGFQQRAYIQKRFQNIRVDGCFSSDLTRACLTAQSIYMPKGLVLQRDASFRELDVGCWEDMPYGYLDNFFAKDMYAFSHDPVHWHVEGSETYEQYTERFISKMSRVAEEYDGGTIAIFCHGAVLRGVLMKLFFQDKADELPISDNAGVSHIFYDRGNYTYAYLNDNSHIPEQLSTYYIQSWWRSTDNRREANLYFQPWAGEKVGDGIPTEPSGKLLTAWLCTGPVGAVSLGTPDGKTGRILGMSLQENMLGRGYSDQLLGCAFSHFRQLGCNALRFEGKYPENVAQRYGFDGQIPYRSIDPNI